MIGLDTNVLVRYLVQDDARQSAIATRWIENGLSAAAPGFISLVVLVELCWVLKRLYGATENEIVATASDLLASELFHVESRAVLQAAVQRIHALKSKGGLTDHLIVEIAKTQGCTHTVSFDKAAVRTAGMRLLA